MPTKSFSMSQPCGTIMPLMAALSGLPRGQTQTSAGRFGMSGLPPIAGIVGLHAQVRSVPNPEVVGMVRPRVLAVFNIGRSRVRKV